MPPAGVEALEAIRLIVAGHDHAGVERYGAALRCEGGVFLPVGLHASMVDRAGRPEAGRKLIRLGLDAGADVCPRPANMRGSWPAIAQSYDTCLEQGEYTPLMAAHHLRALSWCADNRRMVELSDRSDLLVVLEPSSEALAAVPGALAALVNSAPASAEEPVKSFREMTRIARTHLIEDQDLRLLHQYVRAQAEQYALRLIELGHWLSRLLVLPLSVTSWGAVTDGSGGHNVPHVHPGCVLVGVLYLEMPTDVAHAVGQGDLHIGPDPSGDPACVGWPRATIRPAVGQLVLMPSFYTHWTAPVVAGRRVALACNIRSA